VTAAREHSYYHYYDIAVHAYIMPILLHVTRPGLVHQTGIINRAVLS